MPTKTSGHDFRGGAPWFLYCAKSICPPSWATRRRNIAQGWRLLPFNVLYPWKPLDTTFAMVHLDFVFFAFSSRISIFLKTVFPQNRTTFWRDIAQGWTTATLYYVSVSTQSFSSSESQHAWANANRCYFFAADYLRLPKFSLTNWCIFRENTPNFHKFVLCMVLWTEPPLKRAGSIKRPKRGSLTPRDWPWPHDSKEFVVKLL